MPRQSSHRPQLPAVILAWLGLSVASAHASDFEVSTSYRSKHQFYGCWTRTVSHPERSRWPKSFSTWCFQHGRLLGGFTFDAGDAWDYCEPWHVRGRRLAVPVAHDDARECLYGFSSDKRTLTLRDCASAGDWQCDDRATEAHRGEWTCRMQ